MNNLPMQYLSVYMQRNYEFIQKRKVERLKQRMEQSND